MRTAYCGARTMCASERRLRAGLVALPALSLAALFATGASGEAAPPEYAVLRHHSSVEFTVLKWNVYRELGRFTRFDGMLRYDPQRPQASSIEFAVEAASIDTGMPLRDRILRSDDFLDAEHHPLLTFRSTSVRAERHGTLHVSGTLTIRGIVQRVGVPVTVIGVGTHPHVGRIAGFEAVFAVDRTLFGIDGARWSGGRDSLSKDVEVRVRIGSAGAQR